MEMPIGAKAGSKAWDQFNQAANEKFNTDTLQPCPHCARTFLPDRLAVHLRSCRPVAEGNAQDAKLAKDDAASAKAPKGGGGAKGGGAKGGDAAAGAEKGTRAPAQRAAGDGKLMDAEERLVGTVAAKTWRRYFGAAGALWMSFPMALGVVAVLCRMATSGWLAWWCSEEG